MNCTKTTIRVVEQAGEEEDDMDDDGDNVTVHVVHALNTPSRRPRPAPRYHIHINGTPTKALIDTGATINLMADAIYRNLPNTPALRPTQVKVLAYGAEEPLPITGVFKATLKNVEPCHLGESICNASRIGHAAQLTKQRRNWNGYASRSVSTRPRWSPF